MKLNLKKVYAISLMIFILGLGLGLLYSKKKSSNFLLAHNLTTDHPIHQGLLFFKDLVEKESQGRMKIILYPNGQLGSEKEILSLIQLGAITMTKVSSLSLESFSPLYGILNLPFIFTGQEHYHQVLDSEIGHEILMSSEKQRFIGLTYYEAGNRSFYSNKPIHVPDDIKGQKIRVMENPTAIRMLKLLGGSPTPMPYGEVYTALQQGVIDGAENNITALTVNRHGEVSKFYSLDQHIFAPDILIISAPIWNSLNPEDQALLKKAAEASKIYQRKIWDIKTREFEENAKNSMGVQFIHPEKKPFRDKVIILHDEFGKKGPAESRLLEAIKKFRLKDTP